MEFACRMANRPAKGFGGLMTPAKQTVVTEILVRHCFFVAALYERRPRCRLRRSRSAPYSVNSNWNCA